MIQGAFDGEERGSFLFYFFISFCVATLSSRVRGGI